MFFYLLPLFACVAGGMLFLLGDVDWKWKAAAVLLVAGSVAIQFFAPIADVVHWGIPIGMQIVAAIWFWIYWRMEGI